MSGFELIGLWRLETVLLPLAGIRRRGDGSDFWFEFLPRDRAVAHLHGEEFPTGYHIFNRCVVFDRIELSALRLRLEEGLLLLRNYHGVTLIFVPAN